ncbi:MAG: S8/S53 family peptidase [Sulfitobacter sp.]
MTNMQASPNYGQEEYPTYDALWHLKAMGILDQNNAAIGPAAPAEITRKTRVAMIDTSVAVAHPNLKGAINTDLALDLFSTRLGAFSYLDKNAKLGALSLNVETRVAEGLERTSQLLTELNDRLSHGARARFGGIRPTVSADFSVHGTAIAGLIGARPCVAEITHSTDQTETIALPYTGVDPNCEIVPISTNFDPDPEQLIIAFLYAELINADVILLPRIIPDPSRTTPELSHHSVPGHDGDLGSLTAAAPTSAHNTALWEELAQLIIAVSLNRPVVCAAGNANEEFAIYPANLADDHNGIIAVGALNAKGYRCGYSDARNVTVMAPSNDSEVFDRTEVRLDEQQKDYDGVGVPDHNSNFKFSSFDIISTDVPGRFGYSSSPYDAERPDAGLREFGSYFCRFGGTSAASAIVAGFLSLAKSAQVLAADADGLASKSWLLSKAQQHAEDEVNHMVPIWSGSPNFPDQTSV